MSFWLLQGLILIEMYMIPKKQKHQIIIKTRLMFWICRTFWIIQENHNFLYIKKGICAINWCRKKKLLHKKITRMQDMKCLTDTILPQTPPYYNVSLQVRFYRCCCVELNYTQQVYGKCGLEHFFCHLLHIAPVLYTQLAPSAF